VVRVGEVVMSSIMAWRDDNGCHGLVHPSVLRGLRRVQTEGAWGYNSEKRIPYHAQFDYKTSASVLGLFP
jgi:hypothetical protein